MSADKMTLLDTFAGMALQGMLASAPTEATLDESPQALAQRLEAITERAYLIAGIMLISKTRADEKQRQLDALATEMHLKEQVKQRAEFEGKIPPRSAH